MNTLFMNHTTETLAGAITRAYDSHRAKADSLFKAKEAAIAASYALETAKAAAIAAKGGDIKAFGSNEAAQKAALLAACPDEVEALRVLQSRERVAQFELSGAESNLEEHRALLRLAEVTVGLDRQKSDLH